MATELIKIDEAKNILSSFPDNGEEYKFCQKV